MELLKHFELYIAAQKATGMHFLVFGLLVLVTAIALHFSQLNPITQGMRNGFFTVSVLLIVSGAGFILNQNKLLQSKSESYQTDPISFKKQELERMQGVDKSIPKILFGLSMVLVVLILVTTFFVHQPFWKGVNYSLLIYLLGLLILESISRLSVKQYLESLTN